MTGVRPKFGTQSRGNDLAPRPRPPFGTRLARRSGSTCKTRLQQPRTRPRTPPLVAEAHGGMGRGGAGRYQRQRGVYQETANHKKQNMVKPRGRDSGSGLHRGEAVDLAALSARGERPGMRGRAQMVVEPGRVLGASRRLVRGRTPSSTSKRKNPRAGRSWSGEAAPPPLRMPGLRGYSHPVHGAAQLRPLAPTRTPRPRGQPTGPASTSGRRASGNPPPSTRQRQPVRPGSGAGLGRGELEHGRGPKLRGRDPRLPPPPPPEKRIICNAGEHRPQRLRRAVTGEGRRCKGFARRD